MQLNVGSAAAHTIEPGRDATFLCGHCQPLDVARRRKLRPWLANAHAAATRERKKRKRKLREAAA